ncbi:BCCT family transporter [Pseudokordiimonas caeni]|uniref:BCCT family transporter n=1 Tax=Pseudokordiimonas caeni TaxID=2997908 RepID=UPI002811DBDD|nr:choline BCCT transporter BetT [Pseudokordiimonas caeni]
MMFNAAKHDRPETHKSGILPPVFFPAAGAIALIVIATMVAGDAAAPFFAKLQGWITHTAGWIYMLAVTGFLLFCLYLAMSRYGDIKLGPNHAEPDYSYLSWFAMLFSAGIGIGLMFFGVAEPVTHFLAPPDAEPRTIEAAKEAMQITFFHWGINAWGIYAIVGLILAYFSFRHRLPLTIRSALYPLIGNRINGPIGHLVDVLAVVGTLFGVATSLGFGVAQVNAGLFYLFDVNVSPEVQVILIAAITACATVSVVTGLDAGIKRLSELNMVLAGLLLLFVIIAGPTILFFDSLVQNIGLYVQTIVERSFRLNAYTGDEEWLGNWTLFYWGWWISWSPFVGIFIARISRGRTIREFIIGVLLVPTAFTFIWMTAFGNDALAFELRGMGGAITEAVQHNLPLGLFHFLELFPASFFVSFLALILIITFFVTSSDSGSLVIDTITSGGHLEPPVWTRVFWAVTEGLVAAALLLSGGLGALQTATITTALPFTFVIIFACIGLMRGLRMEAAKLTTAGVVPDVHVGGKEIGWKQRLHALLAHPSKEEVEAFLAERVVPALAKVAAEVRSSDFDASVELSASGTELRILHGGEIDFRYAVRSRGLLKPDFAYMERGSEDPDERFYRAEVHLLEGSQNYDVYGFTEEQLIHDVLSQYDKHMHFLHLSRV